MDFCNLETERLLLKNISSDDREFILKQFSDDDVNRYLYDEEPYTTLAEADELIDFYVNGQPRLQHRWILIRKDTKEKIGTCGFHCWNQPGRSVEIGYDMRKDCWGRGYMSEAVHAILDFAQNEMKVHTVYAQIAEDNQNSIRLAKRHGFEFRGETKVLTFRGRDYLHRIYCYEVQDKTAAAEN